MMIDWFEHYTPAFTPVPPQRPVLVLHYNHFIFISPPLYHILHVSITFSQHVTLSHIEPNIMPHFPRSQAVRSVYM